MKNYYNDINVFEINTIKRYSSGFPVDENNNVLTMSLNGDWLFHFSENMENVPQNFYEENFNADAFKTIKVPSNWQFQGYDIPIYSNFRYPKALSVFTIPKINPKKNPVGCYIKYFDLEEIQSNIFLNFGGVNSAAEVYLNGEFVGYSEDTFDEQEYNITKFCKKGQNKLAVFVYRYSTGSYLEDQDMWRLAGIFRDVTLIFKPNVEIFDCFATAQLENSYLDAKFEINASIESNGGALKDGSVIFNFYNAEDKLIFSDECHIGDTKGSEVAYVTFKNPFKGVNLWSHEQPYLYHYEIILYDEGRFVDKRINNFGFRSIEIIPSINGKDPHILLNGKKLKFFGVNRHDFHPEYGHAVPIDLVEKDIILCLQNNITAIRNSHYPNSRYFYDLCDKYGVLVMAENNLETHGLAFRIPKNNQKWTAHCCYRMSNMVNSLKNHPCIVSWSLGNEAGFGSSFVEMRKTALNIDKTRFIHYEPDTTCKVSDVLSEMYATLEKMPLIGQNKNIVHCRALWNPFGTRLSKEKYKDLPFMQCEYSHSMGNSLGNFADYWAEFKKYDRMSGGFIWDFADQAIKVKNGDIIEWRYGGDFGDKPNDTNFAFNGIVRADRTPNPALFEVKKQYQQVDISIDGTNIVLKNEYMFTNLEKFNIKFELFIDGVSINSHTLPLSNILPGEVESLAIPFNLNIDKGEVSLLVKIITSESTIVAPQNHIVAYEQFIIKPHNFSAVKELDSGCTYFENDTEINVSSSLYRAVIDKKKGGIISIDKAGNEIIKSPILPNFHRATIDNDRLPQVDLAIARWYMGVDRFKKAMKKMKPRKFNVVTKNNIVSVIIDWKMPLVKHFKTVYNFGANGFVDIELHILPKADLVRYGFKFALRENFDKVEFYGNGPHENYCDRKTSAILAKYSGTSEDFLHDYLYPQENGNHTDCRYLRIWGEKNTLSIDAIEKPFEFSARPYTQEMLDEAKHLHELKTLDYMTICIDGGQRGVGGDTPAIATLKPPYILHKNKNYSLKFRLALK